MAANPNQLTAEIIGAAIAVHAKLGPGLLESVYEKCLAIELKKRGLSVQAQVPVEIEYDGETITDEAFKIDLLVEDTIILELKSVQTVLPVHKKQLLTYLKLTGKPLGLLINFNEVLLKKGITRIVNNLPE